MGTSLITYILSYFINNSKILYHLILNSYHLGIDFILNV